jgi:hypothetical protein
LPQARIIAVEMFLGPDHIASRSGIARYGSVAGSSWIGRIVLAFVSPAKQRIDTGASTATHAGDPADHDRQALEIAFVCCGFVGRLVVGRSNPAEPRIEPLGYAPASKPSPTESPSRSTDVSIERKRIYWAMLTGKR